MFTFSRVLLSLAVQVLAQTWAALFHPGSCSARSGPGAPHSVDKRDNMAYVFPPFTNLLRCVAVQKIAETIGT